MGFFEFLGVFVFLYYLINVILWIVLDADIELWFKERWGKQRGMNEMYCNVFNCEYEYSPVAFIYKKWNCHGLSNN